jgi:hypothetical protein
MSNLMRDNSVAEAIAQFGPVFNPDVPARTRALYSGLIEPSPSGISPTGDIAYGTDPRQTLDAHSIAEATKRPVLLFVPRGGFVPRDKRVGGVFYRNLSDWFVRRNFLVVTMNVLLPVLGRPGAEDVDSVMR